MSKWLKQEGEDFVELNQPEDILIDGAVRQCFSEPDKILHFGLHELTCQCAFFQAFEPYEDEDLPSSLLALCAPCKKFIRGNPSGRELWTYSKDSVVKVDILLRAGLSQEHMETVRRMRKEVNETTYKGISFAYFDWEN